MRYIKLDGPSRQDLEKIYQTHSKLHVRQRAHCILLSDRGFSVPQLAFFFSTRTHTVRAWFDRWEAEDVKGLEIRPGRGLKPSIDEKDADLISEIKREVALDPRNLRQAVERLNERLGLSLTVRSLRTLLKKN